MANDRLADRLEAMDADIRKLAKEASKRLRLDLEFQLKKGKGGAMRLAQKKALYKAAKMGLKDKAEIEKYKSLPDTIRSTVRKKDGEIERVGFSFDRIALYLHLGVGKGRKTGSPEAARAAKPWLMAIAEFEEQLADLLENHYADVAAAEIRVDVPGYYRTKTSK